MSNKQKSNDQQGWTFSKYRQLKPEYQQTGEILQFLLDVANGQLTIQVACDDWVPVIPIVEHVINAEKRYEEQQLAVKLLEKIADLCPDAQKHPIKRFLKMQGFS